MAKKRKVPKSPGTNYWRKLMAKMPDVPYYGNMPKLGGKK